MPVSEGLAIGAYALSNEVVAYALNDDVVAYAERSGVPDILAYGSVPVKLRLPCMDTAVPSQIRSSVKYEALAPVFGFIYIMASGALDLIAYTSRCGVLTAFMHVMFCEKVGLFSKAYAVKSGVPLMLAYAVLLDDVINGWYVESEFVINVRELLIDVMLPCTVVSGCPEATE